MGGISHASHKECVDAFLENSIMLPDDASEDARNAELHSDQYRLIKRFLELARQHCVDSGLQPGSKEALAAFEEANDTAKSIVHSYTGLPFGDDERKALRPEEVTSIMALLVPHHVKNLAAHIKEKGKLHTHPFWLSEATSEYVKGRFKSASVENILLRALTQVEMVAYMHEMQSTNILTGKTKLDEARPPSFARALWNICKWILELWLVCLAIALAPLALPALPSETMLLTGLGLAAIGTLALLVLLIIVAVGISQITPNRKKQYDSILDMIDRMNGFFLEFGHAGPFSTAQFRKRVNDLADAGVIWPSGLYVLLDDMEARGVRAF